MPKLTPVDFDPFKEDAAETSTPSVRLTPVDFDPFGDDKPVEDVNKTARLLGGKSYRDLYDEMMPVSPVRIGKELAKANTRVIQGALSGGGGLMEYTGHLAERYPGEVVSRPDLEPDSLLGEHTGYFTGPATRTPISTQDPLTQFAKIGGKAAREYWGEATNDPILRPRIESYTDIKSIADGIDYASSAIGNLTGSMSLILATGGVGGGAGGGVAGVVGKEAIKRGLGGRVLEFLTPKAMDVPIGWMEAGEIAGKQLEQYEKDGTDLSLSRLIATTVPAALVERGLGVEAAAAKFGRMGPEFREFSKKHLVPRILEGMGVAGFGEGSEEFVQTYLENYGGNPKSVWTKETLYEALNAGLQGTIGGHTVGGVGGAAAGKQYRDVQNQQKTQQEILANPVDFQHPAAQKMIENRANVARYLEDFIAETDPQLAKAWGEQATLAIGANRPVDMSIITGSGKFDMTDFTNPPTTEPVTEPTQGPVRQEVQDHQEYKPFIDGIAQKLDAGEYSMDNLHDMRAVMAEKYGADHGSVRALEDFIEKRNLPPGVKDGMDMVNKALADEFGENSIIAKLASGTGGGVIKDLSPIDRMAQMFEQQFPQEQAPSFAGITRKQPGMPRPRTQTPVQPESPGRRLGGEPIALPGRVAYTAEEQRRPSETALLLPEKERIHRAIFESLERNDDLAEGMTPMLVESYLKEGGIIPANRADIAEKYPSASFAGSLDAKAHEAATSPQNGLPRPTKAQIEAGNYKKGHIALHGLNISIENPKGSTREGVSPEGKPWKTELRSHYGYILGVTGEDGDPLDTFIGENPASQRVFVVYQNNPSTGKFDEHKVMLGYNDINEARAAYLENYEPGWKGLGTTVPMSMDTFKAWLNKTAPFNKAKKKTPAEASAASAQMEAQPGDFYEFDVPTRPEGPTTFRYKVRSLFVQNDGTIVPLVKDLRSGTVYPIFPSIAAKGRFVKGEEGVVEGSFPMGTKPKKGTPIPAPTESAKRSKALIQIIVDMGGLSAAKVKAAGFNVKEDFQQHGLSFIFRKNGRSLDDIATELVSGGVITAGPDTISSDNHVLSLLQAAARGQKTTIDQMQDELNVAISEQKDDILELKEDLKRHGADESQIKDVVGTYQDATREDTRSGETDRDVGETRARGTETLDDTFVSEVEQPTEETPSELRPAEPSEEGTAVTPAEGEKRAQTPQGEEAGGELFNTSGMFSLSGNQPHEQKTMKVPEKKGERLLDVEKQGIDELKDRLSGEKAKRELEEEKQRATEQVKSEKSRKIEDAGEELVYNKRNRVRTGKTWDDISGLNDALKAKETTKNNVWPKPGYEQMVQDGTPATIAHILKQVYDSIANAPVVRGVPTDTDFKLYIDAVQRVRDGVESWMSNPEAVRAWATKQARFAAAMMPGTTTNLSDLTENAETQSLLDMVYPGGWRNFKAELTIIGGNKVYGALQPGRDEVMRAMKAEKKGWPGKMESWQVQGLKVVASSDIKIEERNYVKQGKKYIPAVNRGNEDLKFDTREQAEAWTKSLKPFLLVSKYDRVISEHDTRESAVEAARERVKKDKKNTISDKGISVAAAERQGPARRMDGEDITAERLSADFGFRGVNFGNWMPDNERQLHLNHAYDSFHDLAEMLNVPPKALSLNGMLGIAFGAQGTGQYAAHFVPGVNEINLTRTSGAGSISHEWGHALDHYFAAQGGLASAAAPFLSEYATSPRKIEGVRPEIVEAFKAIVSAMNKRPQTPQEARQKGEQSQKRSIDQLDKWLQFIRRDFVGQEEAFDKLADRIRNDDYGEGYVAISPKESIYPVLSEIRELYKKAKGRTYKIDNIKALRNWMDTIRYSKNNMEAETEHVAQVSTDYASNALKLDKQKGGKPYWSTNLEKFARAFDAYVSDRATEKAITNTYLSHQGREGEAVPMGKEREAIDKAFDALVDAVETKETDKGVILFKKESSDPNKPFADRLDKFLRGEMGRRIEIVVTNTPIILSRLGAKQLPITISDHVIDKAMRDKHVISLDTLKQLPMAIHDPIAVFKSGDVRFPNALVIMTELRDNDGETVIIAVHLSKRLAHHEVNRIASLYGKDENEWFQKQADLGRTLYVNKEKAVKWSQSVGQLFLPKEATRSGSEKNILTEKDFVKKGGEEDDKPSFRNAAAEAKKGPYKAANLEKLLGKTITAVTENTGVTVKVIQDNYGFPADFIERAGADFDLRNDKVYGAYDPLTGTIYLVADNAESTSAVEKTLFEELVGHKGLPAFLGKEKTAQLRDWVYSQFRNSPDMQKVIRDYGLDVTNAEDRRVAGNEFMIHHVDRPTIMQRVIAYIREALRKMGFKMRYSDADLKTLVGSLMNRVEASMMKQGGTRTASEAALAFREQKPAPVFYSQLMKTVEGKLDTMPGKVQSIIPWLQKQGVKPMELEEMGVSDWLKENQTDGRIDKAAFAEWVKTNQIQVEEVMRGGTADESPMNYESLTPEMQGLVDQYDDGTLPDGNLIEEADRLGYDVTFDLDGDIDTITKQVSGTEIKLPKILPTKFHNYILPGGENYREMLFTLPSKEETRKKEFLVTGALTSTFDTRQEAEDYIAKMEDLAKTSPSVRAALDRFPVDIVESIADASVPGPNYRSSHWSEPNVLAHVRMQDFADKDGNKVLLVEEVQSDWHQEGKKKGYKPPIASETSIRQGDDGKWYIYDREDRLVTGFTSRERAESYLPYINDRDIDSRVPPAPFRENWHEYVMKRILRMAAESQDSPGLRKVSHPQGVREFAEDLFGGEVAAGMPLKASDGGMLAVLQNDKVIREIVRRVPVDVMDVLRGAKASLNQVLNNPSVLSEPISDEARRRVWLGILDAMRVVGTDLRAKLLDAQARGGDIEVLPTLRASELSAREVVGLLAPESIYHMGLSRLPFNKNIAGSRAESSDVAGGTTNPLPTSGTQFLNTRLSTLEGTKFGGKGTAGLNQKGSSTRLADVLDWHNKIVAQAGVSKQVDYVAGYDKLAWTTGEQQAERYDLSKQVENIQAVRTGNNQYNLYYRHNRYDRPGRQTLANNVSGEQLESYVGKDLAHKILLQQDASHTYSGLDLKVGGKGMKVFYDQLIPGFLNKYVKQWGAKVGTTELSALGQEDELGYADEENIPVPSIPITPAMREAVLYEGQPLYKKDESAFRKWFGNSKVVDANGEPLVVYHWTDYEFDAFSMEASGGMAHFGTKRAAWDRSRGTSQIHYDIDEEEDGFWVYADSGPKSGDGQGPFKNKAEAAAFIKSQPKRIEPIAVYLSIKTPLRMPDMGVWTFDGVRSYLNLNNVISDAEATKAREGWLKSDEEGWKRLNDLLRKHGYDGFVYTNEQEDPGSDSWVALSPTQIKSVDNQGTWSAADDRISFKKAKATATIDMDDLMATIAKANPKFAEDLKDLFAQIDKLDRSTEPLGKPTQDIPDPTKDRTKKTESWLNQETAAIFRTIASGTPGSMPHNSFLENVLKSPEWYEHPVFKNIVRLFTMDRERLYHTTMLDLSTVDDQSVIEETDQLRKKNPAAYKELLFAIDYGDTRWKRGDDSMERLRDPDISEEARAAVVANQVKKYETYLREKRGVSPEAIRVWKLHRASYDKALDMMTAQLRALVAQMEEGEPTGQTKTVLQELRFALASMNEWRGFYAPRLRERAGYAVQAEKAVGGKTERYREHKSKYGAERLANKLRSEGWQNVRITEISRLPESVYMNLKAVDVAKAIKDAAHGMKGEAAIAFNDELIEHVSNLIKSRGYRSSMIHRGSPEDMGVVRGYMEDPLERYTTYVNNLAGGFSKSQVAQRAMQMLLGERDEDGNLQGGIDAKAESRTYVTAERYIAEQLRNLDQTDRIVGIAKSIATFKYLGFNPRSMLVNLTALGTTVPASLHQYVLGGKGSMTRIVSAVGKAGSDIATVMVGKTLKNGDEQAFIERIQREGYDDPQLTRDIMGKIGTIHQRAWSKAMGAAMWAFGKTEQFNRMTTMLAAYRLAKASGKNENQAYDLSLDASNKAHGLYGRATLPAWAQGGNPAAKVGQLVYVYGKFGHNYLQMMYDLLKKDDISGSGKRDFKAFLWGFISPIVLAGGAAWPLKDLMLGIVNFLLKLFGFKGDAEKFVYDGIRTHLGKTAEMGARHGITGLAGIDISGSLSIGVGVPRNMWELTGAAGGVYDDAAKALHFLSTGQPGRAAEKALPTAGANFLRAAREGTRMVTSEKGRPLYDDDTGRPLQLSAGQMALRAAGFRPSEQAVLTERRQEHRDLVKGFTDRRDEIYEQARAYYADPDRDSKGMTKLMQAQTDYNQSIRDADLVGLVPFMKYSSLRDQARSLRKVDKRERARLRRDAE